ncbi:MAG: hypothetical protein JSW73_03460 [Candidatus Woesearchaeota archaeon]|nr:MAG: hypothetical protein JSW73_03460 [Candidatus Woesearchaeota archaeon]
MKKAQYFIIAVVLIALIILPSLWFFKAVPREQNSDLCINLFQNIKDGVKNTVDISIEYNGFGSTIKQNLDNFSVLLDSFCAGNSIDCFLNYSINNVSGAGPGGPAVWTTREDCGTEDKNVNKFCLNDSVYINGGGFTPGYYFWEIKGLPGSCDPDAIIANGTYYVVGAFCFFAYRVNFDDCGGYKVNFGGKSDNYQADDGCVGGEPTVFFGPNTGINLTVRCKNSYLHDYFKYP